jgi:TetR/AcrR family transcriptional repressor of lmrAB and yxaGH operons
MPAAVTKSTNKRGATRIRMLLSAAEVMRERGAAGVTIDEVLTRSGAPRGSVYYHFPEGRNQILTEALRFAGDAITATIDGAEGGIPLVRNFVEFWEQSLAESDFNAGCPVVAAAIG